MELDTSQKYAAAALFTLALHETQVRYHNTCTLPDLCDIYGMPSCEIEEKGTLRHAVVGHKAAVSSSRCKEMLDNQQSDCKGQHMTSEYLMSHSEESNKW